MNARALVAAALLLTATTVAADGPAAPAAAAGPAFVQARAHEVTGGRTNAVTFRHSNRAGDLIVVSVLWDNTGSIAIRDSRGNHYLAAASRRTWATHSSEQVFYARNIRAGANSVTVRFSRPIRGFGSVSAHEYSGVDAARPIDAQHAAVGSSRSMGGEVTTTTHGDLLFGVAGSSGTVTQTGPRWTLRASVHGGVTIDRHAAGAGRYTAWARQNGSAWVTHLVALRPPDRTPPSVRLTAPAAGATVGRTITVTSAATDDVGVVGVQFLVDGRPIGPEDRTRPFALGWDTRFVANGSHHLTARARDAAGNRSVSAATSVTVQNTGTFRNETLATGFDLPTTIEFLPDGRLLLAELAGRISVLSPPYTDASPTPFLQLTNVGSAGVQQGIYDIALDPHFGTNHFFYVFYTAGTPNHDRLSRFTANAALTRADPDSEVILYEDPDNANAEHHGGAVVFGNDGKIYFTTGEHFDAGVAQSLSSPRGKIHRINPNGSVPTDDPFYDGDGPNWDSIWAYGLRNPFRAYYDSPTGRLFVADVGGNDYSTAKEEVNLGVAGADYGWPDFEGACPPAECTSPIYSYPHNGRDAAITGGFVYHGTQFPVAYRGNYFFADYTQNWIKRLRFDASGNATVANFEPPSGAVDGPYGDIVSLAEGPDGALYYLDLGYSDISGSFGVSKLRRIRFVGTNRPPIAVATAHPTSGVAPLRVTFSSAGSRDPEGRPVTRSWAFGDGTTSTLANPVHRYTREGRYTVRLTVSDGVTSTVAAPITITVGIPPTARIRAPINGVFFRAGDVISFRGTASDAQDGVLPASAFRWNIDFLHEGHVHPGIPRTGVKRGTFRIPTTGHDFSGNTRYRISLTVVDSSGLRTTRSVIVWPTKVNLTFRSSPTGRTIHLDGIAKTTPFVHDTLVGFHHTIQAPDQVAGGTSYTFASWSDGGARQHAIVVPSTARTFTARFTAESPPGAFVQQNYATPQTPQSTVNVPYQLAQAAGNTNIVAVGWNDATSTITSVTDSRGNAYALAAPIRRGDGLSQAIYYAKNVQAAAAGANTLTVQFGSAVPFADVRVTEYAGLDPTDPFDAAASSAGTSATASSGNVTTTSPTELIFAAGTTAGAFAGPAAGFTQRVITNPDADIVADRVVSTAGTYTAGATLSGSAAWLMQAATFRAAGP